MGDSMETYPLTPDFEKLSTAEKILRLQDAWDRIAENPENVKITETQRQELDSRLDAMKENPDKGIAWEAARDELRKKR